MNEQPERHEDPRRDLETPEPLAYEAPKVQSVKLSDEAAEALT